MIGESTYRTETTGGVLSKQLATSQSTRLNKTQYTCQHTHTWSVNLAVSLHL